MLRTFISSFALKSRSCFVSKLEKWEIFVCDFISHFLCRLTKVFNEWNLTSSLPSEKATKNKHIISFLVAKCNKVDFYVLRLNGIRFRLFIAQQIWVGKKKFLRNSNLTCSANCFLCSAVNCPFNWNFPTGPRFDDFFSYLRSFFLLRNSFQQKGRGSTHNFDV